MLTLKEQYNKERRRVLRAEAKARKAGFVAIDQWGEVQQRIIPKVPKRITKASVNRLKKITNAKIYSEYRNPQNTAQNFNEYQQARRAQRKQQRPQPVKTAKPAQAIRPSQTATPAPGENVLPWSQIVIANFLAEARPFPQYGYPMCVAWIEQMYSFGATTEDIAKAIQEAYDSGHHISREIAYKIDAMAGFLGFLTSMLPREVQQQSEESGFNEAFQMFGAVNGNRYRFRKYMSQFARTLQQDESADVYKSAYANETNMTEIDEWESVDGIANFPEEWG